MRYKLEKVFKYIGLNRKLYLFVFIELILVLPIIYTAINQRYAYSKELESLYENINTNTIYYEVLNKNEGFQDDILDLYKLEEIDESIKDNFILYYGYVGSISLYDGKEIISLPFLTVSDKFLEELVGSQEKYTYAGSEASKVLKEGKIIDDFSLKNSQGQVSGYKELKNSRKRIINSYFSTMNPYLNDTLILPLMEVEEMYFNKDILYYPILKAGFKTRDSYKYVDGLNEELNRIFPGKDFKNKNIIGQFLKGSDDLTKSLRALEMAAIFSLFVIFLGLNGIILIFLNRRKVAYNISAIYGASKLDLIGEIGLELFIIILFSSISSLIVSIVINSRIDVIYFTGGSNWVLILASVVLPLIIVLANISICIGGINHD